MSARGVRVQAVCIHCVDTFLFDGPFVLLPAPQDLPRTPAPPSPVPASAEARPPTSRLVRLLKSCSAASRASAWCSGWAGSESGLGGRGWKDSRISARRSGERLRPALEKRGGGRGES